MSTKSTEVSIWAAELRAGTLPLVCVKSGQPADSKLKFTFATTTTSWVVNALVGIPTLLLTATFWAPATSRQQVSGWLPLTQRWRKIFIAFRAVAMGAAAFGIVALLAAGLLQWPQTLVVLGFGLLGAYFVTHVLYAGLRPKGEVHGTWLHLWEVHPNFIAAVEAIEAQAAANGGLSPDGLSYWDGTQWGRVA